MASISCHAITAYALGKKNSREIATWKLFILGITCSIFLDADIISFAIGMPYESFWEHLGFSHPFVLALLLGISVTGIFYYHTIISKIKVLLISYFSIRTTSHRILDTLITGGLGIVIPEHGAYEN